LFLYTLSINLTDTIFVSHRSFKIPQDEFLKIVNSENRIIQSFEKYVNRYVQAYNTGDENILRKYQFSTLQNYHTELECVSNYSEQQTS
ncbi:hypothetical protein, partial [Streptomyces sp. NPDC059651]|uniref:hypothetical protein n=1 Tax=Streptomyces sp. NPDC059651 TaxID=3346897 RepID=UPI0036B229D2